MFWFFVISLLILVYLWLKHRYSYWERLGVKGPKPVFFFGNLFKSVTFQEHIGVAHTRWYEAFNDMPYIGFYKLLRPALMIRDPELQREILVKAFTNFHENDANVSDDDDLRKMNPFFNNGEEWQRSRALFGTFFSANKIRRVFPRMLEVGSDWEKYVRSLGTNAEVDAKDICSRYTVETMIRSSFSIDGKSFEQQSEFLDLGRSLLSPNPVIGLKMMATFFVQDILKYFNFTLLSPATSDRFKQIVLDQIKTRDSGSVRCEDLLQTIMDGREKYDLNETEVAGACLAFFFESHDTFPNTLVMALYQLAKNKNIQDKLAQTIEESMAANNDTTYEFIQNHEYLEKVVYETLRLHPPQFGLIKVCTKDYTLPLLSGQKQPVTIPASTPILLPFANFRDPKFFPDPERFDPERFSPEQKAIRPKYAFMAFGDGPRTCIARFMGLFNLKVGLFEMIRRFEVRLGPNNKPFELHPMSFSNIPKYGIKLIFTPRKMI